MKVWLDMAKKIFLGFLQNIHFFFLTQTCNLHGRKAGIKSSILCEGYIWSNFQICSEYEGKQRQ